ncbi:MAG: dihydroorotase family protein [Chloroflexota bacterium]
MQKKTIINGTIVQDTQLFKADLVIANGLIDEIRRPGTGSVQGEVIDADGLLVLPGGIDIHFHCRAPAFPERGDFATETRAAAAGGITTIFEMPISKPGTSTLKVFEARRALAEANVYVDFGLYAAPASFDVAEVTAMVQAGAIGFKTFMVAAPAGREDEFEGLVAITDDEIWRTLETIKDHDLPAVFHCESDPLLNYFSAQLDQAASIPASAHALTRPPVVESIAIAKLLILAEAVGRSVHIAHLSTAGGLALIEDAKRRGVAVTAETCPHYLLFTSDVLDEVGPFGKINPPIRGASDQAAMWKGLDEGTIEIVASDHAPFSLREKESTLEDIRLAPPGVPGVEILYPVMLDLALRGRYDLQKVVNLVSTQPARMYGLYPHKGILQVGAQADIVLFDPHVTHVVDGKKWFSKAAPTERLYTGRTLQGCIKQTFLRGEVIYRDGEVVGKRGNGRFVRPLNNDPVASELLTKT